MLAIAALAREGMERSASAGEAARAALSGTSLCALKCSTAPLGLDGGVTRWLGSKVVAPPGTLMLGATLEPGRVGGEKVPLESAETVLNTGLRRPDAELVGVKLLCSCRSAAACAALQ